MLTLDERGGSCFDETLASSISYMGPRWIFGSDHARSTALDAVQIGYLCGVKPPRRLHTTFCDRRGRGRRVFGSYTRQNRAGSLAIAATDFVDSGAIGVGSRDEAATQKRVALQG